MKFAAIWPDHTTSWWLILVTLMMTSPHRNLLSSDSSSDEEELSEARANVGSGVVLKVYESSEDEFMDPSGRVTPGTPPPAPPPSPNEPTEVTKSTRVQIRGPSPSPSGSSTADITNPNPSALDLQLHWNLQELAHNRRHAHERCDYFITAQGHPFGPLFCYPIALPLFNGRGGVSLIGSVCEGLSALLSDHENSQLDLSLSPAALWQVLLTKAPSKSFAFSLYLISAGVQSASMEFCYVRGQYPPGVSRSRTTQSPVLLPHKSGGVPSNSSW